MLFYHIFFNLTSLLQNRIDNERRLRMNLKTGFTSSFPEWAVTGGHAAFVERLEDPEKYRKIKEGEVLGNNGGLVIYGHGKGDE